MNTIKYNIQHMFNNIIVNYTNKMKIQLMNHFYRQQ